MDTITSVIENNKTYILADFLLEKAPTPYGTYFVRQA